MTHSERVTFPAHRFSGQPLSPESIRELTQIGLPRSVPDLFEVDMEEDPGVERLRDVTRLGTDQGSWLVLDAQERIRSIPFDESLPERHVNASVGAFAAFLDQALDLGRNLSQLSDDAAAEAVAGARDRLAGIDPTAFASDDDWWAVVFEQLEAGLL